MKRTFSRLSTLALACVLSAAALAGEKPLHIKGYQAALNQVDLSGFPVFGVQFQAEGGVAHLGKMTSTSTDQQIIDGVLTATVMFSDGIDNLVMLSDGFSQQEADGRFVFQGTFTVLSGTGKFAEASGVLTFDGWARATEFEPPILDGIGFFTFEGYLYGVDIKPDARLKASERGTAVFNGVNFVYEGSGKSSHVGKFQSSVETALEPFGGAFNNQFVGIIDGRFVLVSSFAGVRTHPNGDELHFSGLEFVSWAMLNGGPDFMQPGIAEVYETLEGGTGRFEDAQGVTFGSGDFIPTGPGQIAASIAYDGFISRPNK